MNLNAIAFDNIHIKSKSYRKKLLSSKNMNVIVLKI